MRNLLPFLHGASPGDGPGIFAWTVLTAGLLLAVHAVRVGLRSGQGLSFFLAGCMAAFLGAAGVLGPPPQAREEVLRNPVPPHPAIRTGWTPTVRDALRGLSRVRGCG